MVEKIDTDLTKSLETMEDWYRAVIFDKNCSVLAKKNMDKINEEELK